MRIFAARSHLQRTTLELRGCPTIYLVAQWRAAIRSCDLESDGGNLVEMNVTYLLWALVGILLLAGLAGTILPALPGVPLVFGALLLAAYLDGFTRVGWPTLVILGVLTALAMLADFVATLLGAKRAGASRLALVGAAVGSVLGIFSGLWGLLVFPFIGAVVGELISRKQLGHAGKVGFATWLGLLLGTIAKIAIALTMIGVFTVSYLWQP